MLSIPLPDRVRLIEAPGELRGAVLEVDGWRHLRGELVIRGRTADGARALLPAAWTDLPRTPASERAPALDLVATAEGWRRFAVVVRRQPGPTLAEELVQDVFTRAWRHAGEFDEDRASVRTWLYAIARNAVTDAERRRGRRPRQAVDADGVDVADPDEPIESSLLRFQIQMAVARLTAEHRLIITLVHFRGLRLAEVAERTGLPLGTVKSRLHYAALSLRLALDELEVTR